VWTRKTELQVRAAYGLEVDAAAQAGPVLYSVSDCHGWCMNTMVTMEHLPCKSLFFREVAGWVKWFKYIRYHPARSRSRYFVGKSFPR
jgi:hypothetical protein